MSRYLGLDIHTHTYFLKHTIVICKSRVFRIQVRYILKVTPKGAATQIFSHPLGFLAIVTS